MNRRLYCFLISICLLSLQVGNAQNPAEISIEKVIEIKEVVPLQDSSAVSENGSPFAGASLTATPSPPVRGNPITFDLKIPNHSSEVRELSISGDLGVAAMFLEASDGVKPEESSAAQESCKLISPILSLPPRSLGLITVKGIMRDDNAGWLSASFNIREWRETEGVHVNVFVEPQWPPAKRKWLIILALSLASLLIAFYFSYPLLAFLWHHAPSTTQPLKYRFGAFLLFVLALALVYAIPFMIWEDYRFYSTFKKSECKITDRMLLRTQSQSSDRSSRSSRRKPSPTYFQPLFAVYLSTPDGMVPSVLGDRPLNSETLSEYSKAVDRLSRFSIGKSYPCWYDPKNTRKVTFSRSLDFSLYIIGVGGMLCFNIAWRIVKRYGSSRRVK
jgi:hypothetical protein